LPTAIAPGVALVALAVRGEVLAVFPGVGEKHAATLPPITRATILRAKRRSS